MKEKSFFEKYRCEFCHQSATHYITYKDSHAYLCDKKECDYKYRVKSGIFITGLSIDKK
jgi:cytochrome c551/c552